LGSFDPPHKGHDLIVQELLKRYEVTLLLVPNTHFEKAVQFPQNMTHDQRVQVLTELYEQHKRKLGVGLAYEVLFVRLHDQLKTMFPNATVYFGMGNDVYECFLASKEYFAEVGLEWGEEEEKKLREVGKYCLVFGREEKSSLVVRELVEGMPVSDKAGTWKSLRSSLPKDGLRSSAGTKVHLDADAPPVGLNLVNNTEDVVVVREITTAGDVPVPPNYRMSSSHIRTRVGQIRSFTEPDKLTATLHKELDAQLPSKVIDYIAAKGLYQ